MHNPKIQTHKNTDIGKEYIQNEYMVKSYHIAQGVCVCLCLCLCENEEKLQKPLGEAPVRERRREKRWDCRELLWTQSGCSWELNECLEP